MYCKVFSMGGAFHIASDKLYTPVRYLLLQLCSLPVPLAGSEGGKESPKGICHLGGFLLNQLCVSRVSITDIQDGCHP